MVVVEVVVVVVASTNNSSGSSSSSSSLREFVPLRPSERHLADLRGRVGGGNGLGMLRWTGQSRVNRWIDSYQAG